VPEAEVEHEGEFILMGPTTLDLPAGKETVQRGDCTLREPATILSAAPHMHQLGVHMKATAVRSMMGKRVILDEAYSFDDQDAHLIEPVEMAAGDRVEVECTYVNTTDATVAYGDSSQDEMCYANVLRYPAVADSVACVL